MMECVIIHNMVVLQRKHRYTGTHVAELGKRELPCHRRVPKRM
jgi:hypothetical protein